MSEMMRVYSWLKGYMIMCVIIKKLISFMMRRIASWLIGWNKECLMFN